mmetsp:Transcript_13787/g.31988  ORF Transcript_13787/g.31988 Transcript_13787/m.31988 type:complete len:238 (-) Transcript_13787:571-1284(-)
MRWHCPRNFDLLELTEQVLGLGVDAGRRPDLVLILVRTLVGDVQASQGAPVHETLGVAVGVAQHADMLLLFSHRHRELESVVFRQDSGRPQPQGRRDREVDLVPPQARGLASLLPVHGQNIGVPTALGPQEVGRRGGIGVEVVLSLNGLYLSARPVLADPGENEVELGGEDELGEGAVAAFVAEVAPHCRAHRDLEAITDFAHTQGSSAVVIVRARAHPPAHVNNLEIQVEAATDIR